MNKKKAIALLNDDGWTKAHAKRALESLDFKINLDVDELTVRRVSSNFAGAEFLNRQRLQAAQKSMVTKRNNEIQRYLLKLKS